MEKLAAQYKDLVGYDPREDEPDLAEEELSQRIDDYLEEVAKHAVLLV